VPEHRAAGGSPASYAGMLDHLLDELTLLALKLQKFTDRRRQGQGREGKGFRGYFLEEQDVLADLRAMTGAASRVDQSVETEHDDGIARKRQEIDEKVAQAETSGLFLPLRHLVKVFGLQPPEAEVVVMAVAPEIDRRYERLYAFCNDDLIKQGPTIGLALELMFPERQAQIMWSHMFSPSARLSSYNLVQVGTMAQEGSSLKSIFVIEERIKRYLLGDLNISPGVAGNLRFAPQPVSSPERSEGPGVREKMLSLCQTAGQAHQFKPVFWLYGKAEEEKVRAAAAVSQQLGLPLLLADLDEVLAESDHFGVLREIFREAALQSGLLLLLEADCLYREGERSDSLRRALFSVMASMSWVTFFSAEGLWIPKSGGRPWQWFPFLFELPAFAQRRQLWEEELTGCAIPPEAIDRLAGRFAFEAGKVREVLTLARGLAEGDDLAVTDIYRASQSLAGQRLGAYARRVKPHFRLQDIVLPDDKLDQLREICRHIEHRHTVYYTWGFEKRLNLSPGLNILFSGSSGTGKTMAADIIANEFNLSMYQIDLAAVVSKYIGETEKNLNRLFQEAAAGDVILFFDEADALFGKRSEVKDAHDRYANIEINYLLQKMEEHEGIAILATNLGKNLDEAFLRRLHFTVEFPFPEPKQRLRIWENIFPTDAPLAGDIDYQFLATQFKLAGGNIKNVAVTAAFYAAASPSPIGMRHIILAVKREMQKTGKLCVKSDFGKYYELIKGETP